MTEECRSRITSNQYADFLVKFSGDLSVFERFQTDCYITVNYQYGVVYVPLDILTRNVLHELRYSNIPNCYGLLDTSVLETTGIKRIQSQPNFLLRGQGVLIGIVDTGIEYTNHVFKNADNTTRIVSIWDQTIESENYPEGIFYGTEYSREQINEALQNENPLSVVPTTDDDGHGTFLAGVAAGSQDEENDFSGVVPDAELVIVKLKQAKSYIKDFYRIPEDAVCFQENDIMFGVKYLNDVANRLNRPIAICIGLGSNQGSHDGREILDDYLNYVGDEVGKGIVIAGGNEGNRGHHYYGVIDETTGYDTVELRVGENESGFSMELWGTSPNIYSLDILTPSGEYIPRIQARLGEFRDVNFIFEPTTILIDFQLVEQRTGDELILIRMRNPTPGIWRFRIYANVDIISGFHIWLPMERFITENTFFINPNPDTIVTSPGNARLPITAAAYNHITESLYLYSSRGFTRAERVKPDVTAPGVEVYGPALNDRFTRRSGTSVSASVTTGVVAMLLEWGIIRGNYKNMDTFVISRYLIRGARRNPEQIYPSKEWGYGILDIYNVFLSLISEMNSL